MGRSKDSNRENLKTFDVKILSQLTNNSEEGKRKNSKTTIAKI